MEQGLEQIEKSITELMTDVLDAIDFDLIKIIYIDVNNKLIQESESLNRTTGKDQPSAFAYSAMEKIVQLMCSTKNPVIMTNTLTRIGQVVYKKINLQFACEIFIPLFNGSTKIAGVIYLAKQSNYADIVRNDKYINAMKMLIHILERDMYQRKLQDNLNRTVLLLCEIINAKEPMLMSNLYAVSHWAIRIARQMGLHEKEVQKLQLAALMHNLGKIYMDENLLNKEEYTKEEDEIHIKRTVHSYEIALRLGQIYDLYDIPEIILHFQERVDGKGYPDGLKGNDIPLLSKILCVAKALSSMLTNKPHRRAMSLDEIIQELKLNAGSQFDQKVVEAALVLLLYKKDEHNDYFTGIGNYATLSITINKQIGSTIQLWGQISKINHTYVFSPMEKAPVIDLNMVSEISLYLDINERILRFQAVIDRILPDRILLKKVELQGEDTAFSILWFLEGTLVTNEKQIHKVYINLLGGDYLDFYIFNEENPAAFTSGVVKVSLNRKKATYLPGIITFRQQMNDKVFYRFKYTNVSESERQQVFSSMFKKQLEMRGQLKGTGYFKSVIRRES